MWKHGIWNMEMWKCENVEMDILKCGSAWDLGSPMITIRLNIFTFPHFPISTFVFNDLVAPGNEQDLLMAVFFSTIRRYPPND